MVGAINVRACACHPAFFFVGFNAFSSRLILGVSYLGCLQYLLCRKKMRVLYLNLSRSDSHATAWCLLPIKVVGPTAVPCPFFCYIAEFSLPSEAKLAYVLTVPISPLSAFHVCTIPTLDMVHSCGHRLIYTLKKCIQKQNGPEGSATL